MLKLNTYQDQTTARPTWCPGCGDYGILSAVKMALAKLELLPHEVLFVSGIGCGSKLPDYIYANGYCTLHGRALPIAQGAKMGNHGLKVIAITGDGDGYGIGGNHFMHIMRRNADIAHIVENNMVYGLTKGQYSPTSPKNFQTPTTPDGSIEIAVNPLALAIANGATFIARGYAAERDHLADLIMAAIEHRGYALLDVLQPCVIYNRVNGYDFYNERVYKLEDEGHEPEDRDAAWERAFEWDERIPLGIFYQSEDRPTYEEQVPALTEQPLVKQGPQPVAKDVAEALLNEYA